MSETFTILGAFGCFIGCGVAGAILVFKKASFLKNNGRSKSINPITSCPVPECHDMVITTAIQVNTLKDGQERIFEMIDDISANMPSKIVKLLKNTKGLLNT